MELISFLKMPWMLAFNCIKFLFARALKRFVVPVLQQSHQYHVDLRNWQRRWEQLAGSSKYKILLESAFSNQQNACSHMLVKNDGNEEILELKFSVVAKSGGIQYAEHLIVKNLLPGKVSVHRLNNIPLLNVLPAKEQCRASIDQIDIYVDNVAVCGSVDDRRRLVCSSTPMYMEFFNKGYITVFDKSESLLPGSRG